MNENNLLTRIAEAREGSPELDMELFWIAFPAYTRGKDPIWHCLPYTTSLDAALPGEENYRWEIYGPYRNGKDAPLMWKATCFLGDKWWQAKGHTEALARRGAALKAIMEAQDVKSDI